jgi:hypothetical protein
MEPNYLANVVAALSTLVVGFIYFNPKVFGTAWMNANGLTDEKLKNASILKMYGFTIFFSFVLAFGVVPLMVFHEIGAAQLAGGNEKDAALVEFLKVHGGKFSSFKHGALHGFFGALSILLPTFAINGLFQQRSWKAILIDVFYWVICLTVMGAIICGWTN